MSATERPAEFRLGDQQLAFYRTFGYLVLPGLLTAAETDSLQADTEHAVRTAVGDSLLRASPGGGIDGHYVPAMVPETPTSSSLVLDDRFLGVARQLIGRHAIPDYGLGILYFGESGWHCDHRWPLHTVKFVTYFDDLSAANGALRFLPASHTTAFRARVDRYLGEAQHWTADGGRDIALGVPSDVVSTGRGDVVLFTGHTWHASFGGRNRWSWTVTYMRPPRKPTSRAAFDQLLSGLTFRDEMAWGAQGFPFTSEWWIHQARSTNENVVTEMARAGVLRPR